MTVYHGSIVVVKYPDLSKSKARIDFGPGFYVATVREQAEKWARRKALRKRMLLVVTEFEAINMYLIGLWDAERTLREIRYYPKNDQIVFKNKFALSQSLRFIGSYGLEKPNV